MSARDDARADARFADRSRSSRPYSAVPPFAGFVCGALLAVTALLIPGAVPRLYRFECRLPWPETAPLPTKWPSGGLSMRRVHDDPGGRVAVQGAEPAAVNAAALRLVRSAASRPGATALRAAARERWLHSLVVGPLPPLSAQAECAALLRARAELGHVLCGAESTGFVGTTPAVASVRSAGAALASADVAIERAARAGDPPALDHALDAADRAESAWLDALATEPSSAGVSTFEPLWRARENADAQTLDDMAARIESELTPLQRTLVAARTLELALERERRVPELASIASAAAERAVTPARPIAGAWAFAAGLGGVTGALLVLLRAWRARAGASRRSTSHARVVHPEHVAARLHVLSGADERRVAAGIAELAAVFLARGERVLVMDAGRRLRLHEHLGGDPRWGVSECMAGEMPVLGTVQNLGGTGLYLLARGQAGGAENWSQLGRLMGEARPHFDQIVIALDATAPHAVGEAVRGRLVEGWWAGATDRLPRVAAALSERLGIVLNGLGLNGSLQAALEALSEFRAVITPPAELPMEAPREAVPPSTAELPHEPAVLDCDLQVTERLRFLLWMKGIQAEGRRAVAPAEADRGAALER